MADGGQQNYLKSVEVMVMLDTLRTINNPRNDYALVALLRSPMFAFDEDELTRLALQQGDDKEADCLYDKLERACLGTGTHPELVHQDLKLKLSRFIETLKAGAVTLKSGRSMISFGKFSTTVSILTLWVVKLKQNRHKLIYMP